MCQPAKTYKTERSGNLTKRFKKCPVCEETSVTLEFYVPHTAMRDMPNIREAYMLAFNKMLDEYYPIGYGTKT